MLVYLLTPLAIPFFVLLVKLPTVLAIVLTIFVIATLLFVFLQMLRFQLRVRKELLALLILTFFSMIFWTFYMQMFMTVTLFTDRNVHRYIGHWHVPTAAFPALVGLFNVLLGPIFAWLWYYYGRAKWIPSTAMKFALAQLLMAACFFLLHIGIISSSSVVAISLVWMVLFYLLLSAAELMLSPIGLAAVTRLAPPAIAGLMMGVWFLALSAGLKLAGEMSAWNAFSENILARQLTLKLYDKVFIHCGDIALICAVVMLAVAPWLKGIVDQYIDSPHFLGEKADADSSNH
ncbi:MAG: peptide MFS transporter [Gammaproteobacteria bacterium]|nr:peptide MFS transporter [Gammaproteobacteria bacterium]